MFSTQIIRQWQDNPKYCYVDESNKLTAEQVIAAEKKWGIIFPSSYREFLIEVGASGTEDGLLLWDGSQDHKIEDLYNQIFNSLVRIIEWGVWKPYAWGEKFTNDENGDDLTNSEIKTIVTKFLSESRKLIPVSSRHFTFSATKHNKCSEIEKTQLQQKREKKLNLLNQQLSNKKIEVEDTNNISKDKHKSKAQRNEAADLLYDLRREMQDLTEEIEYLNFPHEHYGSSEAIISFALSTDGKGFDVQDIMMQGSDFLNFLRFRLLGVPFGQVNSDESYNSLRSEPLWGLFVN